MEQTSPATLEGQIFNFMPIHYQENRDVDFDKVMKTGFYSIQGIADHPSVNAPGGVGLSHFHLFVMADVSGQWVRQVAYDVRSIDVWTRRRDGILGVWDPWRKFVLEAV